MDEGIQESPIIQVEVMLGSAKDEVIAFSGLPDFCWWEWDVESEFSEGLV